MRVRHLIGDLTEMTRHLIGDLGRGRGQTYTFIVESGGRDACGLHRSRIISASLMTLGPSVLR